MTIRLKFFASIFAMLAFALHLTANLSDTTSSYTDTLLEPLPNYLSFDIAYTNNYFSDMSVQDGSSIFLYDLSFYHKSGLWASFLPVTYAKTTVPSYDIDLALGYQHYFNSGIDINAYYQNHNYTGDSTFLGIDYKHSLNLSLGYSFNGFYAYANTYTLLANTNNYFADMGIGYSYDKQLGSNQANYLSLLPYVSFSFGTDYWLYSDLTPYVSNITKLRLTNNGYNFNTFDMQSIDIMLPVSVTMGNFTFSVLYLYSFAAQKYDFLGYTDQSSIMLSLNYLLNFK